MQKTLGWRRDDTDYQWSLALDIADFVYDRLRSGNGPRSSIADRGKIYTLPPDTDNGLSAQQQTSNINTSLQRTSNSLAASSMKPLEQRNSRDSTKFSHLGTTFIPSPVVNGIAEIKQRSIDIDKFPEGSVVPYARSASRAHNERDHWRVGSYHSHEDDGIFINNVNEYLRSLNMSELSESEKELLPGYGEIAQKFSSGNEFVGEGPGLASGLTISTERKQQSDVSDTDTDAAEPPKDFRVPNQHTGEPKSRWRLKMPSFGIGPFNAFSAAATAAQVSSLASQVSLKLSWYSRDHRYMPQELRLLHSDLSIYAQLISQVTSMSEAPATNPMLGASVTSVLAESVKLLDLIRSLVEYAECHNSLYGSVVLLIKWKRLKKYTMTNFANYKALTSLVLQTQQVQAMQNLQRDADRNSELILASMQRMLALNEHYARSPWSGGEVALSDQPGQHSTETSSS